VAAQARHGLERRGRSRIGNAGVAWNGVERNVEDGQGRRGMAERVAARPGSAKQCRQGKSGQVVARRGQAQQARNFDMTLHSERVLASKLVKTEALRDGSIRQTFSVLPCPGLQVICISVDVEGELEPISQVYELPNGAVFDDPDIAFTAWADFRNDPRRPAP
jgi:hypothetical protein